MQKEISFIDNNGIKEFNLGKSNFIWTRKETVPLQKYIATYKQDRLIFFSLGYSNC